MRWKDFEQLSRKDKKLFIRAMNDVERRIADRQTLRLRRAKAVKIYTNGIRARF